METDNQALTRRGERTRQRILDTAEVVFADMGYTAARLEDVAQAVGIRRASIVYYFPNKQELYRAVEARIFEALDALIEEHVPATGPARDRLLALIDCSLDFMVARPTAARLTLRNSADNYPGGPNPVQFSDNAVIAWETIVQDGVAHGEFTESNPIRLMSLIGGGTLLYATLGNLLGNARRYDPGDPGEVEHFRALLHHVVQHIAAR